MTKQCYHCIIRLHINSHILKPNKICNNVLTTLWYISDFVTFMCLTRRPHCTEFHIQLSLQHSKSKAETLSHKSDNRRPTSQQHSCRSLLALNAFLKCNNVGHWNQNLFLSFRNKFLLWAHKMKHLCRCPVFDPQSLFVSCG